MKNPILKTFDHFRAYDPRNRKERSSSSIDCSRYRSFLDLFIWSHRHLSINMIHKDTIIRSYLLYTISDVSYHVILDVSSLISRITWCPVHQRSCVSYLVMFDTILCSWSLSPFDSYHPSCSLLWSCIPMIFCTPTLMCLDVQYDHVFFITLIILILSSYLRNNRL